MSSNSTQRVEVPALALKGIEHARDRGVEPTNVEAVRAVCRRRGCYYASAWIGNHRREYLRGVEVGFVEAEPEELPGEDE